MPNLDDWLWNQPKSVLIGLTVCIACALVGAGGFLLGVLGYLELGWRIGMLGAVGNLVGMAIVLCGKLFGASPIPETEAQARLKSGKQPWEQ